MSWFNFGLSTAVRGFWCVLSCLLLWTTTLVRALGGYIPPTLRWKKDNRSTRAGPERSETPCPVWLFWRVLYFLHFWMSPFFRDWCKCMLPKRRHHRSDTAGPDISQKRLAGMGNGKNSKSFLQEAPQVDTQPNLNFYLGKRRSMPDGVKISEFHDDWYGSYKELERVHTFIQWLFPLPEPGVNPEATPLTSKEIEDFCNSTTAKENLLKSYKLMLDFYGIHLRDETTGEVERAPNWRDRFRNLNCHTHNNRRITRILKCLGILGFPHYQEPLVRFFLNETLVNGELQNVRESALNYFLPAVLDNEKRRDLTEFARNY